MIDSLSKKSAPDALGYFHMFPKRVKEKKRVGKNVKKSALAVLLTEAFFRRQMTTTAKSRQ